jgi:hypothetical protein
MRLRFHAPSLLVAGGLLAVEVGIARYVRDAFVRPYVGDFLVVILLFYLAKAFVQLPFWRLFWAVLLFAYAVECTQVWPLVRVLGWDDSPLAVVVLGRSFEWGDLLAYTLGLLAVAAIEGRFRPTNGHN